jgi:hypothetical protein
MFVACVLLTVSHTSYLGMFIAYLHNKVLVSGSNSTSVIGTEPRIKKNVVLSSNSYVTRLFYKMVTYSKISCSSNTYYNAALHNSDLCDARVAPTS